MVRHRAAPGGEGFNPWKSTLAPVIAGILVTALAGLTGSILPPLLRFLLLATGLITVGAGISARFRKAGWSFEERLGTSGHLLLAAGAVYVAGWAADPAWHSLHILLAILMMATIGGGVILLLPQVLRHAVVSILALIHFGGILTAVCSVPAPGGESPWITSQLWARFYRPYLESFYLNNAYHFYSPEPGPPNLLWFYIEYEDGTMRQVKLPNREDFPTRLQYQRRLALSESTNQMVPQVGPEYFQQRLDARMRAGAFSDPPIPLMPGVPANMQYRLPAEHSKRMIESYVRHVATAPEYRHPEDPTIGIKRIKFYRVVHKILHPHEFAEGNDPLDPTSYLPYFQGEFDGEGKLVNPEDPFLYWLIPIYREELTVPDQGNRSAFRSGADSTPEKDRPLRNYLDIHAGIAR